MVGYKLRIALRYLLAPKSHAAVNVISLVSVGGVAVAVAAIVCVLSVFNGFNELVSDSSDTVNPDIVVSPVNGKVFQADDSLLRRMAAVNGVASVVPVLEERALAVSGTGRQVPVRLLGVADDFAAVSGLASTVVDGTFGLMTDAGEALTTVSSGIAINLTVTPGPETQVGLLVPRRTGRINPANPAAAFRSDTLTVAGVFQTEHAEYDTDLMILPIASARELLQYDTPAASAIYLGLDGGADVAGVVDALAGIGGGNFTVKDRAVQQETSYRIIAIEKWITFALMVFILLVASFNIISTLAMLIVEKASTIEILRSLGASRDDVVGVFNRAGWLICFVGVVGGLVVGSALCLLQQHFGFIHLNGDSEMLITDIYPVSLRVGDLLAVAAISVVVGLMTTFFTTPFTRRYLTNNNI